MSEDLIQSLKAQIDTLTRENKALTGKSTRRRDDLANLRTKYETLQSEHTKAVQERDSFKTRAESNPTKDAEEMDRLRGELRTFKHREGISQLAYSPEVGLNKSVPVDRLMKLIDYKPETDDFNPQSVKQVLVGLKQSDPYLFGEGGTATSPQAPGQGAAALNPSVAAMGGALGRGSSPSPFAQSGPTPEQMRDPGFMSQYNAAQRAAARK